MAGENKKKKSIVKRVLKWTGISFLLLLIALILIPIFFKEQIKDLVINEANKMLKADIALGGFDLTFISTFPKMTLTLEELSVTGRDEFDGVRLVDIKRFDAHVGFWSVISGDDITINSIALHEPKFDVRILSDGTTNYDIMKSEEELKEEYPDEDIESTPFNLTLSHYEINNAYIRYDDQPGNMFAELVNLTHEGNGDLTLEVIDFETKTIIDGLTYKMDGITYMNEVETDFTMNLLMEFSENSDKFTLKQNELRLNNLSLSFDGYYEMLDNHDDMDITLNAQRTTFKDLLSLVPAFYHTGYESMLASGDMELKGFVKGKMDSQVMPAFQFGLNVRNAGINYPDMPSSIDNIRLDMNTQFPGGADLDNIVLDINAFQASFVDNTLDAELHMRNPMTDPYLMSKIVANVDLSTIEQVYPLEEGENLNGLLYSDLLLDGRMSALEEERYEDFKAEGSLKINDFHYESESLPEGMDIHTLSFLFSPDRLLLEDLTAQLGQSDFAMKGEIQNYMNYVFNEEALTGTFDFNSTFLDIDALMPEYSSEESEVTEEETTSSEEVEPVLIPNNIDFTLNTRIDKMNYDGMEIKNLSGMVSLKEEVARLDNLSFQTLGGGITLSGLYNTQNHAVPQVEFGYGLKDIDIQSLVQFFPSVATMAPIMESAFGAISSDFRLVGDLQPDFSPIYSTLTGGGSLFTNEVEIRDYEPIERLRNTVEIDQLKDTRFRDVRIRFSFEDGLVRVQPFTVRMGNISTTIEGTTSFEQEIDYKLNMQVPRSAIPGPILQAAEQAVSAAQNIPGFKMKELPAIIPVNALITNTVTDPKIKTDFREQLMELGGDVKGAVKELVDETIEKVKDTVRAVVEEKIEDVKDDLRERRDKIINDAQRRADKVVAEAKTLADRTRREADENAQKLIDEAGNNPVRLRGAEVAAERVRKTGEDSAQRIEREAQERADAIMKEAREQASRLD